MRLLRLPFLVLLGSALLLSGPVSAAETQELFLRRLYAFHSNPRLSHGVAFTSKPILEQYFDAQLTTLLLSDAECRRRSQSICGLDMDPIYAAQDFADHTTDLSIQRLPARPGVLRVSFTNLGRRQLLYTLTATGSGWRIHDITYPDGTSLRHLLLAGQRPVFPYEDTNQLVLDPSFLAALKRYFGSRRFSYYWKDGLIADQVLEGLHGPPDSIRPLPDQPLILASACRAHSCMEKAAVILAQPDRPVLFGILHYPCFGTPVSQDCSGLPILTIVSRSVAPDGSLKQVLIDWATDKLGMIAAVNVVVLR